MIDTHIHLTDVFGDYEKAPAQIPEDSSIYYRTKLTEAYLPYGITTAMVMGQPEKWLKPTIAWMKNPLPNHTDIYTTGGALISKEDRKTYINHVTVSNALTAKQKIEEYYNSGIRHIKLYWRLRRPEFESAFNTADSLGMNVYGHVDYNVMFMDTTLMIGLKNYEHLYTIVNSVLSSENDWSEFNKQFNNNYEKKQVTFHVWAMELFRYIDEKKQSEADLLIDKLSKGKVTFSTAIHAFAEKFGMTYFSNIKDTNLTKEQIIRCAYNTKLLMNYSKKMFDKGIKIRMGTDCPNGGKAIQSEQLLLYEYGFSIPSIIQICTINGATSLGMDKKYGSIEKGKKANLVIYERNPFDNYKNFLSKKTVIKDGVVFAQPIRN